MLPSERHRPNRHPITRSDDVYDECAFVEFIEDHPSGIPKGSAGRYQLKELRKPEMREAQSPEGAKET